jgi:tryptophan synthase alpha chain
VSRIGDALVRARRRPALIAYLTVGYPSLEATPLLVEAIAQSGADMVELGIPFSDPLADGPTIQSASQAALRSGASVARALEVAQLARARTDVPLLFMTYLNPVLAFGIERFCRAAAGAGIDGLIVPDLPPEEATELRQHAATAGLDLIFFVSPTSSPARIRAAGQAATGFIYCIALTGLTGARDQLDPAVLPLIERIRGLSALPVVVGFGISRPEHLHALAGHADGVIVASALLDAIARSPDDAVGAARRFVIHLRQGAPG